ncbi:glycosyltransferase family 2 protein [Roseicella aerolata]|uniref:Glycosyltransferase family 2 protein n=1 Tax=Roseicella aerolata TaxID=2883479 RepID=A0A9X1IIH1_9PROT|nr:glycosyltransferase family A protein [Roseicella aerolata]MCB4825122.1 glycosyltransferase family 2 protein [Roseicella aerolata]
MTPVLSIVIPAYNIAPYIGMAVRSALDQTLREVEVIVVDDGSTDETAAEVERIRDPRLRLLRKANGGLSSARNAGIVAARGRHVGLLDGDDVWTPTKAERQVAVLEGDPSVCLTYSYSAYLNEDGTPTGAYLMSRHAAPTWRQMIVRNHLGNGSTAIGRRDDFLAAGLFDERFRTAFEEYELWPRMMRLTGRGIRLVPEALTGYRIRATSGSMRFDSFARQAELARRLLAEKMPDVPTSLLDLGLAGSYRIAARKAASLGQSRDALGFLAKAVRLSPGILVRDPRFFGTLALALTRGRGQGGFYRIMRAGMGAFQR